MTSIPSVSTRNLNRLATVLALLVLLFAGLFGLQAWKSEKEDQISQMRTALTLGQNAVDKYFSQVEASLIWLAADLVQADGRVEDIALVDRQLHRFQAVHPEIAAVNLIGLDGTILASSGVNAAAGLPKLADEPSFKRFVEQLSASTRLTLGQPLNGKVSDKWVTPLRHVIRDQQGRPVVVLAASVPVELLASFWQHAPITAKAAMGLIRDDGFLISRFPVPEGTLPEKLYGQPRNGALFTHLKQQGFPASGYVEGLTNLGDTTAGNVFKRLDHFPVTMFVTQPMSALRAAWWQHMQVPFALLTLLSIGGWLGYRYTLKRQTSWDTARREAEAELRKREGEQRFLIDHILAGVVVHDSSGSVLSANAQACRLLGLTSAQLLGRAALDPLWHFLCDDGSRMAIDDYPAPLVRRTQRPISDLVVGIVQTAGAAPVWVLANAYPAFDSDHRIRSIIVTFVDITARKLAEQALQQSENRYRMLYQNSMDAVMQTQRDGSILAANDAACRMFGLSESELIGQGRQRVIDPDDHRLGALLELRARTGRAAGELTMRRGDGSRFEAEISSALYADASGVELASIVVRDVTERRRSEADARAKHLAEQANRAKSEFIARMSHELRTPLNAILGFTEVLQLDERHALAPVQRERLTHVQRAGDHLLLLINDLLDLSRIEAGALSITLRDADALETVQEAVGDVAPQAATHGVLLRIEHPTQPLPLVRVDLTRLRQVVLNLLSNAIKYNRPGGDVLISLSANTTALQLTVRDTGLGMNAEQLEALFQPFNRLGRESSPTEGTGIGLVITRNLVELMGGQLTVHSAPGLGSSFTVSLVLSGLRRRRSDQDAQPGSASAADSAAASAAAPDASVRGRAIYIDDDEVNQMLMQAFMAKRPGIALSTVSDGPSGVAMALATPPDLMLIDLMMPGMNGFQVMAAVRAAPALAGVRCVAVSANAMPDEINAALAAGFDSYLTKPIALPLLLAELDQWLGAAD